MKIYSLFLTSLFLLLPCDRLVAQSVQKPTQKVHAALHDFLVSDFGRDSSQNGSDLRYSASMVDLNEDGKPEVLLYVRGSSLCGSGGCSLLVLEPAGTSFKTITRTTVTQLPIQVLASTTNGWHDIGVFVAGGGIRPGYTAKLPFNGHRYPGNPTVPPARRLTGYSSGYIAIPKDDPGVPLYP